MTVKIVEASQQPTHRFFRNGDYVYLVANGKIEVAHACVLGVEDVEVKNGAKWEKETCQPYSDGIR